MADYVRAEKTVKYIRYELLAPTNGTQLDTVLHAASRSFNDIHHRPPADDELRVTTEGELIVVSFKDGSR